MKRILKGVKKSITVELAATRLSTLLTTIPGDEVKPFILRANDNLNNTHEIGRQTKSNVDVPEFFDQVEGQMHDTSDIRMSNDIERALLNILYALSSENIRNLSVPKMMSILKLLSVKVGINENDSFAIRNILNGLIWKSRDIPISELCTILSFSYKRKIESNNNKIAVLLFEESLKNAERRWVEIVNAKEFTGIVHYYPNQVSEQFMRKLESRITDFIEKMDAGDLAMVSKPSRVRANYQGVIKPVSRKFRNDITQIILTYIETTPANYNEISGQDSFKFTENITDKAKI